MQTDERKGRKGNFRVNLEFEGILKKANKSLSGLEDQLVKDKVKEDYTGLVFFCYPPRSGSTMIAQTLARTGKFDFISNFIARFWEAPFFALYLQEELKLRELVTGSENLGISSSYGATSGIFDPHEFGFFWNKMLTNPDNHFIEKDKLGDGKIRWLKKEVSALLDFSDRPFFFKNAIAGYNINLMYELFPGAKFIIIDRDPLYIAQSIYNGRIDLYNDANTWWSLRPREYKEIIENSADLYEEIALQVKLIYQEFDQASKFINPDNFLRVDYQDFCMNPGSTISRIMSFAGVPDAENYTYAGQPLKARKELKVDETTFKKLENSIKKHF